jgi:hypothetical protein
VATASDYQCKCCSSQRFNTRILRHRESIWHSYVVSTAACHKVGLLSILAGHPALPVRKKVVKTKYMQILSNPQKIIKKLTDKYKHKPRMAWKRENAVNKYVDYYQTAFSAFSYRKPFYQRKRSDRPCSYNSDFILLD